MAAAASSEIRQLDQVAYSGGVNKLLLTVLLVGFFAIAFVTHFPLEKRLQTLVKSQLAQLPGCRAQFDRLQLGFFMPKITLTNVILPAGCTGARATNLGHLTLHFTGPSFSPFGLAFLGETEINGQPLALRYAAGLGTQVINIQEDDLQLSRIGGVVPNLPKLQGRLRLNARVTLSENQLQDLQLLAESRDFSILSQNINGLRVPRLDVGLLSLKATSESPQSLRLEQFVLGTPGSPIRAKFNGTINVAKNIAMSPLNIKGEAAFSPQFLESFAILNMLMASFTQKDGFYQIRLGGFLGAPVPSPL